MKRFLFLATLVLLLCSCTGHLKITDNGKSDYQIVIGAQADSITEVAAQRLKQYLTRISGAELPVVTDAEHPTGREIIIGVTNRPGTEGCDVASLEADGFEIFTQGDDLYIIGGYDRGNLNGVYGLLDDFLGCRLYAPDFEVIPENRSIRLPKNTATKQVPVLTYRSIHYTPTWAQNYIDWHKISHIEGGEHKQWGLWVHTYEHLVPPAQYWNKHPEYYSLINGHRQKSQLCLSNPAVLEIVCENLAKEIEKKPWALYWSVSSNDNFGYCQCDECAKMDELDGSPTGSVIQFTNKVAERFPDKIISTLAYQYSRAAPKVTKPRKNVNIMFCNIECNRAEPIATDSTSASFRKDMEDWAKLTDNIIVWDYVIQFANLVSPFPNFHTLQPNIQYFVDNSVVAIFEQGNREIGGEFSDLRSYVVSKLIWDPYLDMDALMADFCNGYYGAAGPYIIEYIDDITAELKKSGRFLGIFDGPITHADTHLSPEKLKEYHAIFEKAERAVADQPDYLRHVKIARQPLYYAQVEQARAEPYGPNGIFFVNNEGKPAVKPEFKEMAENFVALCKEEGVTRVTEWHTTPAEYGEIITNIINVKVDGNKSYQKSYALSVPPHRSYAKNAETQLTDGLCGTYDFKVGWLGWTDPEIEITVDLGEVQPVSRFTARFLQRFDSWIFFPTSVEYSASTDGKSFTKLGSIEKQIDQNRAQAMEGFQVRKKTEARYIKLKIKNIARCPDWHQGAGGNAFVFVDEITVE